MSAFKIDFRKEVDPFCGYSPRVLACDGTHIGFSLRHLKLEKPVTKPDKDNIMPWVYHNPERHMFHNEEVRNFVRYMCGKFLNHVNPEKLLDPNLERALTAQTLGKISKDKPLKDFVEPVLLGIGRKDYLEMCAEFLHTLSGDEFIGTVIPPRCILNLQNIFGKVEGNENCSQELGKIYKYNPQISDLFWIASGAGKVDEVIAFLLYLIERIEAVHYKDSNPTEVQEIPNSYDPRTETAYYFTKKGK